MRCSPPLAFGLSLDPHCDDSVPVAPIIIGSGSTSYCIPGDCQPYFRSFAFSLDVPPPPPGCGVWWEFQTFVRSTDGTLRVFNLVDSAASGYWYEPNAVSIGWGSESPSPYGDFVRSGAYDRGTISWTRVRATTFAGVRSEWTVGATIDRRAD